MKLDEMKCTEVYEPQHEYTFTAPCAVTGKEYSVTVPAAGLFRLRQGEYIQNALADLSVDDREFLITGITPDGWDKLQGIHGVSCE